jgi:hypothetical protein
MFLKQQHHVFSLLIVLLGLYAFGCNDSSPEEQAGDTPVSPQVVSLPGPNNPFRPDTEIVFTMPLSGRWSGWITNFLSDTVRTINGTANEGDTIRFAWNGDDDYGTPQPDGIYFARITAGQYVFTKKLLMLWRP